MTNRDDESLHCEEVRERLTEVMIEGRVSPEVELHLGLCESCREEAASLRHLWAGLERLDEPVPTDLLRARFDGMLESYSEARIEARPRPRRSAWRGLSEAGRWGSWLAAAACLVVGIGVGRWTVAASAASAEGQLTELRREVSALNQQVTLGLLSQTSVASRLEGVSNGQRLGVPDHEVAAALSDRIASDPNVNVRLAAVDALQPLVLDPWVQRSLGDSLPLQDSPMVQIALIDFLLSGEDSASRSLVASLLNDSSLHPDVRRHIRRRLGGRA
ncbi:MAG: hypothetical protein K8J08_00520 [Thermoanaerobaculia bacterium]|nr:hypothetical protein [Thermoanaerobaculia bacterium]